MGEDIHKKNKILVVGADKQSEKNLAGIVKDGCEFEFGDIEDLVCGNEKFDIVVADNKVCNKAISKYVDFDTLTGLYNKDKFFRETRKLLDSDPDTQYVLIRFDINRFSLINSYYGHEIGDQVLCRIASGLRKTAKVIKKMTYGRLSADIFGACMPFPGKERFEKYLEESVAKLNEFEIDFSIVLIVGAYIIDEPEIPVDAMCVRATLAIKNPAGNHIGICSYYNNKMRINMEADQRIINEMNEALETGQFVPYFQPKYDVITNKPVGAEALARWIHPTRGIISPAEFIPVFERNGFISKLDFYIWEQVCKYIADWKKRGLPIFPISVNVSRFNLYNPNLVDIITSLTKKYDVEPKYLNLELTESLYTEMNELISRTTGALQEKGFLIMMDDFGSGYSSLNVLKDVPVDVLKMDMRFMSKAKEEGRAENILASIIRMAKWLNMPVVAEGVDKKEQVDFLRGIGCDYIQGFYYAKPMPADEYEKLIESQKEFMDNNSDEENSVGWNAASAKKAIESTPLPMGIFEYFPNKGADVISVNQAFYDDFGYDVITFLSDLSFGERDKIYSMIEEAISTGKTTECVCGIMTSKHHKQWIKMTFKNYARTGISNIIIASFYDITDEKKLDKQAAFCSTSVFREQNRRKNVLVISPEEETAKTLKEILEADYNVKCLSGCREGFEHMLENQTDMVILDSSDVISDIKEFTERVRNEEGDDKIIITVGLSDISPQAQRRVFEMGADDFLLKPFVDKTVKTRVKNLLEIC